MIIRFPGQDRVYADRPAVAQLYGVSERSVRRHCPTVAVDAATRTVLVDAVAAAEHLAGVTARPNRTVAYLRTLAARTRQHHRVRPVR